MWFALVALKYFRSTQFKHNGLVVVPGEAQLDWPVDQLFLNSRANFAFASTDRNTEKREPHVPGLNVQGQQRVHGPDDQEPAGVRAAERDVIVGQPVDALVKWPKLPQNPAFASVTFSPTIIQYGVSI